MLRTDGLPHLKLPVAFLLGSTLSFELLDPSFLDLLGLDAILLQTLDVLDVAAEVL